MDYLIGAVLFYIAWLVSRVFTTVEENQRRLAMLETKIFNLSERLNPVVEIASKQRLEEAMHNFQRLDREARERLLREPQLPGDAPLPDPSDIRRTIRRQKATRVIPHQGG